MAINKIKEKYFLGISLLAVFVAGILIGGIVFVVLRDQNGKSNANKFQTETGAVNKKTSADNSLKRKDKSDLKAPSDNISKKASSKSDEDKFLASFKQHTLYISPENEIIFKGDVRWQKPEILKDLGLTDKRIYNGCVYNNNNSHSVINPEYVCPDEFKGESQGVQYIKVGKIIKGKFKDYDVIILKTGYIDGPGWYDWVTMLKKDKKVTFLLQNKDVRAGILGNYFNKGDYEVNALSGVKFEELNFPDVMRDDKTGAAFVRDKYTQAFFDNTNLKVAFQHPIYGTVWMTNPINYKETKSELNSYMGYDYKNKKIIKKYNDIFGRNGFYIRMPNGLTVAYKLRLDIFDKVERSGILQAIWNDGSKNVNYYEENPSGCGSGSYVYNETGEVDIKKDLVPIGKTIKGDVLYGYADTSSEDFNKLYNEIYHPHNGGKKKSKEEFLAMRPKVFWIDPYGRLLAFYSVDIIPMAECGKPVIYLYPKQAMNVNVQVEPNQGISVSEPKYSKNGWNVFAKPDGELILNDKKYPYLFWEGASDVFYRQSDRGWVVSKKELNNFFDDKLKQLGLIQKEIDDFKEFWIPKMTQNNKPYYFITFLSQRKINQLAPLHITPKPDTVIRIMMDYKELEQKEEAYGFEIRTPKRKGFTVVEWGGMLK